MLLLSGSLIEFFLAPILGSLSDGLTLSFGRRRIFIIIGSVVALVSLLLLYFSDALVESSKNQLTEKKSHYS